MNLLLESQTIAKDTKRPEYDATRIINRKDAKRETKRLSAIYPDHFFAARRTLSSDPARRSADFSGAVSVEGKT
jgi:hypothetical protein